MKPTGAGPLRASVRPAARGETSPQRHNTAARHRLRESGRKSLDPALTTIVVKAPLPLMLDTQVIDDPAAATVALGPMRSRLLSELATPASAATLATRVGLARQRVNYHLHALEAHGL